MKRLKSAAKKIRNAILSILWHVTKNKVKSNKILFVSYSGAQMSDSPLAVYRALLREYENYKFVWVYNGKRPSKKDHPNTTFVKYSGPLKLRLHYHIFTSAVILNNARFDFDIRRKDDQIYIQTWHASMGLKKIERDVEAQLSPYYVNMAKVDSKNTSLLLSGCKFKRDAYKTNFWYDGEIAEFGTPRNDVFFKDDKAQIISRVKADLGIGEDKRILLYAPTFRNDNTDYLSAFDEARLRATLGDGWVIAVRLHPNEMRRNASATAGRDVIDTTSYGDLQELLIATDILVTDYSSTMFDFFIQKKPCFLFCPDYDAYVSKERDLNFDLSELPFPLSRDMDKLAEDITGLDGEEYAKRLDEFNARIGSYEDGHATERVVEIIKNRQKGAK